MPGFTNDPGFLTRVGVAAADISSEVEARALADKLGLELLSTGISPVFLSQPEAVLYASVAGLYLQQTGKPAPGPISVDFGSAAMRHRRRAGQNDMLGRAAGIGKKPNLSVLDATAGLGRDSFVLADLGCDLTLCERHPLIAEMLASALERARVGRDDWLRHVCSRMLLIPGDARSPDNPNPCEVDVIYLDPMFPTRSKSASVKKEMALFQRLLEIDEEPTDAAEMLPWALAQDVARVVVKRPIKAPPLSDRQASHTIAGKSVRYDVYVKRALV
jgi:16S rRNA (guanine1516-N2)-methyltransferase